MGLFDKLDLSKVTEAVEKGAKAAQDSISKIDAESIGKAVEGGVQAAQKSISGINVTEMAENAKTAAESGVASISKAIDSVTGKTQEPAEDDSCREFVSLLWYLASVDGQITDAEREKIDELASGIDERYADYAEEIAEAAASKLAASCTEFGSINAAKIEAQRIVEDIQLSARDAKLATWNLLAVANSDGLDTAELDFIRFFSEKAGVPTAVFEELRNYSDALVEIGASREKLRSSSRPFSEIEPLVNEFAQRESVIIEAAQSLITDK